VFLNLVGNALDAVKESKKKEIHVEISPNPTSAVIRAYLS
jgi:C4-dicarboxylate-specific signal transduction histidine kinase